MPGTSLQITWNAEYELRKAKSNKLVLLLHGFQQSGSLIYRLLEDAIDSSFNLLAPNAPFPIPQKTGSGYRVSYTWYFFDPETDTYFYDMSLAIEYIEALLKNLDLKDKDVTVIGYSQGGYLAPFVAERLSAVSQVIGVNCRFRDEALTGPLPFRLDAIHGAADVLVDPKRAQRCHEAILENGGEGVFRLIEGGGHGITPEVRHQISTLLRAANP